MSAIAAINIAKQELGMQEEDYRSLLQLVVGKTSLREMTPAEHGRVLDAMAARGARPKPRKALAGAYGTKLQALWLSGWNLGLVRNQDDQALLAFVRAQTGIDHTRFLANAKDARKAVEALKGWLARGGVDWTDHKDPKDCVIEAQLARIDPTDRIHALPSVRAWVAGQADDQAKIALMKRLGTRIRSRPADAASSEAAA